MPVSAYLIFKDFAKSPTTIPFAPFNFPQNREHHAPDITQDIPTNDDWQICIEVLLQIQQLPRSQSPKFVFLERSNFGLCVYLNG